jgi:hypothetical protein
MNQGRKSVTREWARMSIQKARILQDQVVCERGGGGGASTPTRKSDLVVGLQVYKTNNIFLYSEMILLISKSCSEIGHVHKTIVCWIAKWVKDARSSTWSQCYKTLIYCHSTVTPSFCVIKQYYDGNYHVIAVWNTMVIYHGISTLEIRVIFITLAVNYRHIWTLEKVGFLTAIIYHGKLPQYYHNIGPRREKMKKN